MKLCLAIILSTAALSSIAAASGKYYVVGKDKDSLVVTIEDEKKEIKPGTYMRDLELNYDPQKKKKKVAAKIKPLKKVAVAPKTKSFQETKPVIVKGKTIQPGQAFSLRSNDSVIDALAPASDPFYETKSIYRAP